MTRREPVESEIELGLSPGAFIRDRACFSFVSSLEEVLAQIDQIQKTDSARAAGLGEIFLAGCKEKAEEFDDSSGSFGQFSRDLICRWIQARQLSGAGPDNTAATLPGWMDNDPYTFCYQIEKEVAWALDKVGLAALERLIRGCLGATHAEERYGRGRWGYVLRAIYLALRNPAAYEVLAEQFGLEPRDCLALAAVFVPRKPDLALAWVERGIELNQKAPNGSMAGYGPSRLRRELLTRLGRGEEAIDAAWAEYRNSPSKFSFDDLMHVVPKAERAVWRERALDAAEGGDLCSVMELLVETKETECLAKLVRGTTDLSLENVCHDATEPAAMKLEKLLPELAARLWRAQAMRIVDAGESEYYDAAAANLERACKCHARAGLVAEWDATVRQIRADHFRKFAFMAAFESVAAGAGHETRHSYVERTKDPGGVGRGGGRK